MFSAPNDNYLCPPEEHLLAIVAPSRPNQLL